MAKLKTKLSSWRSAGVNATANNTTTYFFMDTSPNMFYIQNPSEIDLYVSLSYMPTLERYEFKLKAHGQQAMGRPLPVKNIYILNPSAEDVHLQLWSIEDEFDLSIFQDINVDNINLSDESLSGIAFDGVIKGFTAGASLPAGTNTIGRVTLPDGVTQDISDTADDVGSIQADVALLKTKVDTMSQNISNMSQAISDMADAIEGMGTGSGSGGENITDKAWTYVYKNLSANATIFPDNTVKIVEVFMLESEGSSFNITTDQDEVIEITTNLYGVKIKVKQINFLKDSANGVVCLRYMGV